MTGVLPGVLDVGVESAAQFFHGDLDDNVTELLPFSIDQLD